ncbi:hypothetical protein D9M68_136430 [compost metagenome]
MNRRLFISAAALGSLATAARGQGSLGTSSYEASGAAATRVDTAASAIRNADSVQSALAAWGKIAGEVLPFVHLTALVAKVPAAGEGKAGTGGDVRRIFSTVPKAYPVGGWKHLGGSEWASHVLQQQKVLIASGDAALARYFPDHALLRSLGTRTLINLPVVVCRQTVGAFAFLCGQEAVDAEAVAAVQKLVPSAAAVFIMAGDAAA